MLYRFLFALFLSGNNSRQTRDCDREREKKTCVYIEIKLNSFATCINPNAESCLQEANDTRGKMRERKITDEMRIGNILLTASSFSDTVFDGIKIYLCTINRKREAKK